LLLPLALVAFIGTGWYLCRPPVRKVRRGQR
jgi:hypothetical protein